MLIRRERGKEEETQCYFSRKSMLLNPGLTDSYRNVDRNISL